MDKDLFQLDRETKQNYLRETIIEGGFDPNIFQDYLNERKPGGGANVDLWSFDELIKMVDEFKQEMEKSGFMPKFDDQNEEAIAEEHKAEDLPISKGKEEEKKADNGAKAESKTSEPEAKEPKQPSGGNIDAGIAEFETITKEEVMAMNKASQEERRPSMLQNVEQKLKEQIQDKNSDEDNFYKVIQCKDVNPKSLNSNSDVIIRVAE